jgi:hypothetical protein
MAGEFYKEGSMAITTINIRIDSDIKAQSVSEAERVKKYKLSKNT